MKKEINNYNYLLFYLRVVMLEGVFYLFITEHIGKRTQIFIRSVRILNPDSSFTEIYVQVCTYIFFLSQELVSPKIHSSLFCQPANTFDLAFDFP